MLNNLIKKTTKAFLSLSTNLSIKIDIEKLMSFPWRRIIVNLGGVTQRIHEKGNEKYRFCSCSRESKKNDRDKQRYRLGKNEPYEVQCTSAQ